MIYFHCLLNFLLRTSLVNSQTIKKKTDKLVSNNKEMIDIIHIKPHTHEKKKEKK